MTPITYCFLFYFPVILCFSYFFSYYSILYVIFSLLLVSVLSGFFSSFFLPSCLLPFSVGTRNQKMGVYCVAYPNQILFDCLWGTCSSSIRRPRVAQCTRKLAQVTTLTTFFCMCPGPILAGTPTVVTERCCGFALFCHTCRHATTTGFLSHLPLLFSHISLFIVIQSFDIIC